MQTPRPVLLLSLATVAGTAILLSLGFWQLERAKWRESRDVQIQAQQQLGPVYITRFPADDLESLDQRRVRLLGKYQDRQFLLDNQVRDKQPGFLVLTPFELSHHEQTVLVDRGWIPQGERRGKLPEIRLPDSRERQVEGTVHRAEPNPFVDDEYLFEGTGWPQVVQEIAYDRLAQRLEGPPLVPVVLRLHPEEEDGFRRDWPTAPMTVEKHLAYAFQWFAMALVFMLLMLGLLARVLWKP